MSRAKKQDRVQIIRERGLYLVYVDGKKPRTGNTASVFGRWCAEIRAQEARAKLGLPPRSDWALDPESYRKASLDPNYMEWDGSLPGSKYLGIPDTDWPEDMKEWTPEFVAAWYAAREAVAA
jgi:hypothetical protein